MQELMRGVFGSHLYKLNTPNSDMDYKGIIVPELDDLLLSKAPKSINTSTGKQNSKNCKNDVDNEDYSLHYFIHLALKGETAVLDMMHCDKTLITSPEWEFIVQNRKTFYTKKLKAFMGYLKSQVAKYSVKGARLADMKEALRVMKPYINTGKVVKMHDIWSLLPEGKYLVKMTQDTKSGEQTFYEVNTKKFQITNEVRYVYARIKASYDSYGARAKLAEQNDAIDWKAVSHALRAGYQLKDIYKYGDYEYPLAETDYLKKAKTGQLIFKGDVQDELDRIMDEVTKLAKVVDLPDKPDVKFWENWVLNVYKEKLLK